MHGPQRPDVLVRDARSDEAALLTRIALESKAHWGYPDAQMRIWRDELTVSDESIARRPTFVAEVDGEVAGFCQVAFEGTAASLAHLWVRPVHLRRGAGRALVRRALACAEAAGCTALDIDADPHAESFYVACGATRVGVVPAPISGEPKRTRSLLVLSAPMPDHEAPRIEFADAASAQQELEDRLYAFNSAAVGRDDGRTFALVVRGPQGELRAGLSGWTWADACEIRTVWVDAPLRRRGLGRRLLRAAEAHASERGCAVVMVASYDFQAPGFYERQGYALAWRLGNFPPGHSHHYMVKRLLGESS